MLISQSEILKAWDSNSAEKSLCGARKRYYEGTDVVTELLSTRIDGRIKTVSKTNFVKNITGMYAGFLTTNPVSYSLKNPAAASEPIQQFRNLYERNQLNAIDTEHLINSLLYGYSVEVHSFVNNQIKVTASSPLNWFLMHDEYDNVVGAITKVVLPEYSTYKGAVITSEKTLFYVYDDKEIEVYEKDGKELKIIERTAHSYGRVPVVVFRVSKDYQTFFSESFLRQCDLYNVINSSLIDDIKYSIDALLTITGSEESWQTLFQKDENGVAVIQKLKESGFFPLPTDSEAEFLTRNVDVEKFKFALRVTRENIHRMANVPDLFDRLNGEGATNSISGIALRLLFQGMEQQSAEFANYFEEGLRDRIALINIMNSVLRLPLVEDIEIRVNKNIPRNEIEYLQYITNLNGIVAKQDQLKLLPFIHNPETAYFNLQLEQSTEIQEN